MKRARILWSVEVMTNKEFGKLQELILMFEKDFRGICRKSGRTCDDCSFSAGYEGCTLSQCSKAISEIRAVKKDGTTIIVGDYKLTKDGKAKVYEFIKQARIYKKELIKSGVETEHSRLDNNNRNVIVEDIERELKYESGEVVNFYYEIADEIEITLKLKRDIDFYKVV